MTHIITSLCLRDGACMEVCPVECIVPGKPEKSELLKRVLSQDKEVRMRRSKRYQYQATTADLAQYLELVADQEAQLLCQAEILAGLLARVRAVMHFDAVEAVGFQLSDDVEEPVA